MATESNAEVNADGLAASTGRGAGSANSFSNTSGAISANHVACGSVNANGPAEKLSLGDQPQAMSIAAPEFTLGSGDCQPEIGSRSSGWRGWLWGEVPSAILVFAVRGYQVLLGPFLGGHCRFQPTCSHYFIGAVKKHGPWRGAWRGVLRVLRCHPFRPGGYDPP
ncbi:MAG: membrane protein insertion efficiency factor YidD [Planctomycetota bacterium]